MRRYAIAGRAERADVDGGNALLDITLTPAGHLVLVESVGSDVIEGALLSEVVADSLRDAFKKECSELLLLLATFRDKAVLPPAFAFWRGFGECYLTELCHISEPSENLKQAVPASLEEFAEMAVAAPPMRGGEYVRTAPLAGFLETVLGRAGLMLRGGTVVRRRKQIVDEFQREAGPPFMVLSLRAGGTGRTSSFGGTYSEASSGTQAPKLFTRKQ